MKSEFSIGRKAFSLLELLVLITLLALVSALIYGAFFQVSNSSLKVKESLSQSQELRPVSYTHLTLPTKRIV